jgi:hypothetical protein
MSIAIPTRLASRSVPAAVLTPRAGNWKRNKVNAFRFSGTACVSQPQLSRLVLFKERNYHIKPVLTGGISCRGWTEGSPGAGLPWVIRPPDDPFLRGRRRRQNVTHSGNVASQDDAYCGRTVQSLSARPYRFSRWPQGLALPKIETVRERGQPKGQSFCATASQRSCKRLFVRAVLWQQRTPCSTRGDCTPH